MKTIPQKCKLTFSQFHRDKRAAMQFVNVVYLMLCVALVVFTGNVANVVDDKAEMQPAADSVAYSCGQILARSLNAITAANHTIGELTAFVIVHEALGGEWLDEGARAENQATGGDSGFHQNRDIVQDLLNANDALEESQEAASSAGARTPAFQIVRQEEGVFAGATILAAKIELKELLNWVYWKKVAAKILQAIPYTRPAGEALERAMDVVELKILQEYLSLNALQGIAQSLVPLKQQIRDRIMPDIKKYTDDVVELTPQFASATAREIADKYGYSGTPFPNPTELPVEIDPHAQAQTLISTPSLPGPMASNNSERTAINRDQIVKITQLARATFPWVTYHRKPIWDALALLVPLSGGADFYKHYTDGYSKRIIGNLQIEKDMGLYVLKDYPAPDKGYALWTEDGKLADDLFAVIGLVHDEGPKVTGVDVFKQHHKEGRVTLAQTLIYNANPQEKNTLKTDLTYKRISPNQQADVGMDTLNWVGAQTELVAVTDAGGAPQDNFPPIKLNWQVKLVPATADQLQKMKYRVASPYAGVVARLLDTIPSTMLGR